MADFQEKDRIRPMSLEASLSDKGHLLDNLNQQILSLIKDEDEIGTDIDRASEVDLTIKDVYLKSRQFYQNRTMIHR